jgi:cytochrome c peroxidase
MQQLGRRTPTILNLAWAPALFWDGRAESLEEQALGPIEAAGEMNMKLDDMVRRLDSIPGYRALFEAAYPREPIAAETVAKAIATFERGVVSAQAPFDRWVAGDEDAISAAAQRGFLYFNQKARCSTCHSGWRFTDDSFHDIGIEADDLGRAKVTPRIELARFAFKTPTLRSVAERAPYLHDGSAETLEEVMALYTRGGAVHRPSLSPEIKPLGLTSSEEQDVVAFLKDADEPGCRGARSSAPALKAGIGGVTHHIYSSTKGHEFDLATAQPGEDVRHTFSARGRVEVRCGLHPSMRLVVTVE